MHPPATLPPDPTSAAMHPEVELPAEADGAQTLRAVTDALTASFHEPALASIARVGCCRLPSRTAVARVCDELLELVFPGFFGRQELCEEALHFHTGQRLYELREELRAQLHAAMRFSDEVARRRLSATALAAAGPALPDPTQAAALVDRFLVQIPVVRRLLATDVQAAFDGDPAASCTEEIILAYPGLYAIAVFRLAHVLFELSVPLLPRIMTEHAHTRTGIDIHPGASIGPSFFIDHGTGVVIGETCVIGQRVRIYQGVTLGGLRPSLGQQIRGTRRHPTIEDDVVIFAGATILGGETTIGRGCTIGGSVFLTSSVPPHTRVTIKPPELTLKQRKLEDASASESSEQRPGGESPEGMDAPIAGMQLEFVQDFQI